MEEQFQSCGVQPFSRAGAQCDIHAYPYTFANRNSDTNSDAELDSYLCADRNSISNALTCAISITDSQQHCDSAGDSNSWRECARFT